MIFPPVLSGKFCLPKCLPACLYHVSWSQIMPGKKMEKSLEFLISYKPISSERTISTCCQDMSDGGIGMLSKHGIASLFLLPGLNLDNLCLGAFYKSTPRSIPAGHLERVQHSIRMTNESRPITPADSHPSV